MIPNLQDLPPLLDVKEESRFSRLWRPLSAALALIAGIAGVVWLYTRGIPQVAQEREDPTASLQSTAAQLWLTGGAPLVAFADPDLVPEITRLRGQLGFRPEAVVQPAENRPGTLEATHEILYRRGDQMVMSIRLYYDEIEQRIDLLSFRTSPEFVDPATVR